MEEKTNELKAIYRRMKADLNRMHELTNDIIPTIGNNMFRDMTYKWRNKGRVGIIDGIGYYENILLMLDEE